MAEKPKKSEGLRGEMILGFGVMAMIFMLIIPLPPALLDILLAVNIAFAILVLLITLGAKEALELSTYPTILLLTTLFRLALNVASTRLILLKGQPGEVIQAFGDFVVGGNLVVGIIIFAILVIIQFIVITKGSGRVSEVAARFTLDAMPGKQMAIDADLNAGLIDEEQARSRREKISKEAEFYGSMDGASKFVRGDAIAGLIINAVNVVGGVVVGTMGGLGIAEALERYTILTIGDGLVSQIPALIIAVSAGLLVTKTSSNERVADEFKFQLFGNVRAMGIGASVMCLLALIPGFPKLPFIVMGLAIFALQRSVIRSKAQQEAAPPPDPLQEEEEEGAELTPEALGRLLEVDRMGIEIGFRLISLVDTDKKGGLLDHIAMIRRQFAKDQGMVVPPIRLKDNLSLDPNAYRILISGQEVARGELYPNHVLAMDPGSATEEIQGIRGIDPTFGMPATWVRDENRAEAEMLGYAVVDAVSVMITHLTETIRRHGDELLSRDDVQTLLDRLKEHSPTVVKELVPDILGLGEIQQVMQNLMRERVSVRNLGQILEVLADHGKQIKDIGQLTELVRQRLARSICAQHASPEGILHAIVLDPELESAIEAEVLGQESAGGLQAAGLQRLQESAVDAWTAAVRKGHQPVILTRASVRRYFAEIFAGLNPALTILSYNEVAPVKQVEPVGQISLTTTEPRPAPQAAPRTAAAR
ncbi:MAG: flagellar biosynthesis protein FlhA [Planctomycetota bacterium]